MPGRWPDHAGPSPRGDAQSTIHKRAVNKKMRQFVAPSFFQEKLSLTNLFLRYYPFSFSPALMTPFNPA